MVKLRNLNPVCRPRRTATSIPAQIACRLLGNEIKPCQLDKICQLTDKGGIWVFYGILMGATLLAFVITYWFLTITRLSRVLYFFLRPFMRPLQWLFSFLMGVKDFFDSLHD